MGPASEEMTVKVINTQVHDGTVSHSVEVESPPEMKGRRFWVAQRPGKNKGFI